MKEIDLITQTQNMMHFILQCSFKPVWLS